MLHYRYALPSRSTIRPDSSLTGNPDAMWMPIHYITMVGTDNGNMFHFRLYLVSQASGPHGRDRSISIDMKPDYSEEHYMRGYAELKFNEYAFSSNAALDPFRITMPPGVKAAMLLSVIFDQEKLDKYL